MKKLDLWKETKYLKKLKTDAIGQMMLEYFVYMIT